MRPDVVTIDAFELVVTEQTAVRYHDADAKRARLGAQESVAMYNNAIYISASVTLSEVSVRSSTRPKGRTCGNGRGSDLFDLGGISGRRLDAQAAEPPEGVQALRATLRRRVRGDARPGFTRWTGSASGEADSFEVALFRLSEPERRGGGREGSSGYAHRPAATNAGLSFRRRRLSPRRGRRQVGAVEQAANP